MVSASGGNGDDFYNLSRFVEAQDSGTYDEALDEMRTGQKTGHWMWFIFPQIVGLGKTEKSASFAISCLGEAKAYLAHEILGPRLLACTRMVLGSDAQSAEGLLGSRLDAKKLRSSMTLFMRAAPENPDFVEVLDKFFDGDPDSDTDSRV